MLGHQISAAMLPHREDADNVILARFCGWCETIHSTGDRSPQRLGAIVPAASKCFDPGSPDAGGGVDLVIVREIGDEDEIDPRSSWALEQAIPLHKRLYLLRETLAPMLISGLFRIEIGDPIGHPPIIYSFDYDQIDVSVDLGGAWHATHHHTAVAPTDIRNIESRGADFLSLISAFSGESLGEVACDIVKPFTRSLPSLGLELLHIFDGWEAARCPRRPDFVGDVGGRLNLRAALRENSPNLPAIEGADLATVLAGILARIVPVIARETLPEPFHEVADGFALTDALMAVYGLPEGVALLRVLEAITAASLGRLEATAFVELFDGGTGGGVADRVRAMFLRPEMRETANDD